MKKLLIILISVVVLAGCTKNFYDINTSPNNPTNASLDLVLANALKTTAQGQQTGYQFLESWMGYWTASGSYACNSSDIATYKEDNGFADGFNGGIGGNWSGYYDNLEDYDFIEKTATATNNYFYIGAAKVMKAFVFQQLVDMFNNIPYSAALQGTSNIQPKYDDAKGIYEDLAKQLDAAVVLFQRADAVGSVTQDIVFGKYNISTTNNTQNDKWAKFANTLKLRLLLRQTEMAGRSAYISTEIGKILANGSGFLTVSANVNPVYSNSTGKQSPFYAYCINTSGTYVQDYWRASTYVINYCITNNDPRYTRWYAPITGGAYVGGAQGGCGTNAVGSLSSVFGPGLLQSVGQDAPLLTLAESWFLQSEAALRGWLPAVNEQTAFNSGVQASFTWLGAGSSAAYTSQAGNRNTNYGACATFTEKLNCIMRQKWAANHTLFPFETWCDYRRLFNLNLPALNGTGGIPITVHPLAEAPIKVPTRILYPTIEVNTNLANVTAQGTIDYKSSKIFWMP